MADNESAEPTNLRWNASNNANNIILCAKTIVKTKALNSARGSEQSSKDLSNPHRVQGIRFNVKKETGPWENLQTSRPQKYRCSYNFLS